MPCTSRYLPSPPIARNESNHEHPSLSRALILLMATATGLAVASNYYAQPLLHSIAEQFGLDTASAGTIVIAAQLSYGAGLLLWRRSATCSNSAA